MSARREIELEDLCGLPAVAAVDRLRAAELRPAVEPVDTQDSAQRGRVIDHAPGAHSRVRRGQLITLLIGQAAHTAEPAGATDMSVEHEPDLPAVPAARSTPVAPVAHDVAPLVRRSPDEHDPHDAPEHVEAPIERGPRTDDPQGLPPAAELRDEPADPSSGGHRGAVTALVVVLFAMAGAGVMVGHAASLPATRTAQRPLVTTLTVRVVAPARPAGRARVRPERRSPRPRPRPHRRVAPTAAPRITPPAPPPPAPDPAPVAPVAAPRVAPHRVPARTAPPVVVPPSPTGPLPGPYPEQR
jgi:hypothetical protein